jgi:hypothetical protein
MNLVERGVERGNEPGGKSPGPPPAATWAARYANTAVEKQEKDEVLDEVSGFANEMVNEEELVFAEPGEEPEQDGLEELPGVIGGKRIRGHDKDEKGPEKSGPPGTQQSEEYRARRNVVADLVEVGGGAGIAPGFGRRHSVRCSCFIVNEALRDRGRTEKGNGKSISGMRGREKKVEECKSGKVEG